MYDISRKKLRLLKENKCNTWQNDWVSEWVTDWLIEWVSEEQNNLASQVKNAHYHYEKNLRSWKEVLYR